MKQSSQGLPERWYDPNWQFGDSPRRLCPAALYTVHTVKRLLGMGMTMQGAVVSKCGSGQLRSPMNYDQLILLDRRSKYLIG